MKKMLLLLLTLQMSHAANYLPLSSGIQLYDVEVVVFARPLTQPDSFQVSQRDEVDLTDIKAMQTVEDMPWLIDSEQPKEGDQWQVPIEGKKATNAKALAWFAFDGQPQNNGVFKKIDQSGEMRALYYQKWRQPATPYRNPGFVKISTWSEDRLPSNDETASNEVTQTTAIGNLFNTQPPVQLKPDFTIRGKIAFSKQRFQHGHVDVNLYRASHDGQTIIYRINQSTQIDLNKWQYFDHTQFGVMLKVSLATDFTNPQSKP